MEQFLKERQKQEQLENFDYDLKFLPYSAQVASTSNGINWLRYLRSVTVFVFQAETASEGQSEHLVDLPQVSLLWYFDQSADFQMKMSLKVRTQDLWNLAKSSKLTQTQKLAIR